MTLPALEFWQIIAIRAVCLFGGFTKGVTGFALPLIMVSGMAMVIDPKLAISAIVLPTFVSNIWQALQNGYVAALDAFKKHGLLITLTLLMIFIHAQWIGGLNFEILLTILGGSIAIISLVQIVGVKIELPESRRTLGAIVASQIAGFFGALSGTWGPPTMIYLLAINTPKAEQTRVAGISFGLGALVFAIAHGRSGLITKDTLLFSLLLLIPVTIGQIIGNRAQDKIDQATFRKAVLWVLFIAGLNILRKAVM